ncbi:unnamed protein product [Caenorhabditis auriculariae]|uniref:SPK domain-containing protein n=1 Tax=Caenorhabditis auriculariae TaxID=2777116 RepID=A0A8S1GT51_9PELO|nr:unnamed protein product [Caenorhabditis auriculariae]
MTEFPPGFSYKWVDDPSTSSETTEEPEEPPKHGWDLGFKASQILDWMEMRGEKLVLVKFEGAEHKQWISTKIVRIHDLKLLTSEMNLNAEPFDEEEEQDIWCFIYSVLNDLHADSQNFEAYTISRINEVFFEKYKEEWSNERPTEELLNHFRRSMVARLQSAAISMPAKLSLFKWLQIPMSDEVMTMLEQKHEVVLNVDPTTRILLTYRDKNQPDVIVLDDVEEDESMNRASSVEPEEETKNLRIFLHREVIEKERSKNEINEIWAKYVSKTNSQLSVRKLDEMFFSVIAPQLYKVEKLSGRTVLELYKALELPVDKHTERVMETKYLADVREAPKVKKEPRWAENGQEESIYQARKYNRPPGMGDPNERWRNPKYDVCPEEVTMTGMPGGTASSRSNATSWNGDDRVGLGSVRLKYTIEEEVAMWEYLYDAIEGNDNTSTAVKGHRIWYDYIRQTKCRRTADNLCSHFRRIMINTLYKRPLRKKTMLELYRRLRIRIDEDVKNVLETQFNVSIRLHDHYIVNYTNLDPGASPEKSPESTPERVAPKGTKSRPKQRFDDDYIDDGGPIYVDNCEENFDMRLSPLYRRSSFVDMNKTAIDDRVQQAMREGVSEARLQRFKRQGEFVRRKRQNPIQEENPDEEDEPPRTFASPVTKRVPVAETPNNFRYVGVQPARWDIPESASKPTKTVVPLTPAAPGAFTKTLLVNDDDIGSPSDVRTTVQSTPRNTRKRESTRVEATPRTPLAQTLSPLPRETLTYPESGKKRRRAKMVAVDPIEVEMGQHPCASMEKQQASLEEDQQEFEILEPVREEREPEPENEPEEEPEDEDEPENEPEPEPPLKMTPFLTSVIKLGATYQIDLKNHPDLLKTIAADERIAMGENTNNFTMLKDIQGWMASAKANHDKDLQRFEAIRKNKLMTRSAEISLNDRNLPKVVLHDLDDKETNLEVTRRLRKATVMGLLTPTHHLPIRQQALVGSVLADVDAICARDAVTADDYRKLMNSQRPRIQELIERFHVQTIE